MKELICPKCKRPMEATNYLDGTDNPRVWWCYFCGDGYERELNQKQINKEYEKRKDYWNLVKTNIENGLVKK